METAAAEQQALVVKKQVLKQSVLTLSYCLLPFNKIDITYALRVKNAVSASISQTNPPIFRRNRVFGLLCV